MGSTQAATAQRIDYIASGKAGKVYMHNAYEFQLRHENVDWTGYNRSWTDDVLFHHGCHVLDFSLWTVGAPVRRIRGELTPIHDQTGTSLDVGMLLRYTNETVANLSLSYSSPGGGSGNIYLCEAGTLTIDGRSVRLNGETISESDTDLSDHVLAQNQEFVEAIREGRPTTCGAEVALEALELLQQVYDQMVTLEGEEKYKRMWEGG